MRKLNRQIIVISFLVLFVLIILFMFVSQNNEILVGNTEVVLSSKRSPHTSEDHNSPEIVRASQSNKFSNQQIKNYEVSPYPTEVSSTGVYSIYPLSPFDLYSENLGQALAGDDIAQYNVALALRECKGVASKERIKEFERLNEYYDLIVQLKAHNRYCEKLIDFVAIQKLGSYMSHYEWMVKSQKNDNPLANAFMYATHPDKFEKKDALNIIVSALNASEYEDINAYSALQTYLAQNYEHRPELQYAVEISLCNIKHWCDGEVKIAYLEYSEKYASSAEVKELSKDLKRLIEKNNVTELIEYLGLN